MTEAAHQMASNPLPPGERRAGSVGRPTGTEIAILDERWLPLAGGSVGEVCVRGPGVVDAYRANPEATAASFRDGWFRTGDSGQLSPDGYLTLAGRIKELINRGGEKISPHEVEDALLTHPAVVEAVAFAVPDAKYGETVGAAVVARSAIGEDALRAYCGERLAASRCPGGCTCWTRSRKARRARSSAACWPSSCREGRRPGRRGHRLLRRRGARARRHRRAR